MEGIAALIVAIDTAAAQAPGPPRLRSALHCLGSIPALAQARLILTAAPHKPPIIAHPARPICEWTVWKREANDPGLGPHSGPFPRIWTNLKTLKFISLSDSYRAYHQNICLKHAPDETETSQLTIGVSILRLYRFYKANSTVKTGPIL